MGSTGALPECQVCLEERRRLEELPCCAYRLCQPCVRRLRPGLKCPQCRAAFRENDARTLVFGAVECWECGRDERAEYALWCEPCHRLLCFDCHNSPAHASHTVAGFQRNMRSAVRLVAEELESAAEDSLRRLGRSVLPQEIADENNEADLARRLRQAAHLDDRTGRLPESGDELPPPQERLRSQATRLLRFLGGEPAAEGPRDSLSAVLHDQGPAAPAKVLRDWLRREAAGGCRDTAVQPDPPRGWMTGEPLRLLTTNPGGVFPDRHGEVILALSGSADQAKVQWFIRGFHPAIPMETSLAPLGLSGKCRCVAVGSSVLVRDARRTWELKVIGPGWVEASVPKDDPVKPPFESAEVLKLLLLPSGKVLAAWEVALGESPGWAFTVDGKHILPPSYRRSNDDKTELLGLQTYGDYVHVFVECLPSLYSSQIMWEKINLGSSATVVTVGTFHFASGPSIAFHQGQLVMAGGKVLSKEICREVASSRVVCRDLKSGVWDEKVAGLLHPQLHLPLLPWHGELVAVGWTAGLSGGFVRLEALVLDSRASDHRPIRDGWRAPHRLDTHTADFVVLNDDSQLTFFFY